MTEARTRNPRKTEPTADHSHADDLANAEIVRAAPHSSGPISIRLSAPLLERLDRLAQEQHRKRSNLIQHVLWEYVHAHDRTRGS